MQIRQFLNQQRIAFAFQLHVLLDLPRHDHLIPSEHPDPTSPRHFALHVDDARAAREHLRSQGIAITETEPIAGADRFFIQDPDGNSLELIEWQRRWQGNGP